MVTKRKDVLKVLPCLPRGAREGQCRKILCEEPVKASYFCAEHLPERRKQIRAARYGTTVEALDALLAHQNHSCAICATPIEWTTAAIDHDHACCNYTIKDRRTCGKCVRGFLCPMCNLGIGSFGDNAQRMQAAIEYLSTPTPRSNW